MKVEIHSPIDMTPRKVIDDGLQHVETQKHITSFYCLTHHLLRIIIHFYNSFEQDFGKNSLKVAIGDGMIGPTASVKFE